mgnify:FL=1
MKLLEPITLPVPSIRQIGSRLTLLQASNAVIAFIFAISAPVAIMLGVGAQGGLSEQELSSWIFGAFVVNGCLSIGMSLIYRQPLAFFWTIPGSVLLGPALEHLDFAQIVGAFYVTGLVLLVLGLSGWVRRIMSLLPMPIIMAMVAGVFVQFGLDWVDALLKDWLIAVPMTVTFVLLSLNVHLAKRLPPMIGVLIVGILAVVLTGGFEPSSALRTATVRPVLFVPVFSWQAIVELTIPLAITVLAAQNAQGIAILRDSGHSPPTNSITAACGVTSLVSAVVGTVSTCLTGPVNALISSGGDKTQHYTGAILVGLMAIAFGIMAPVFTHLMLGAPSAFIATLAGLAMLRILQNTFMVSFRGSYSLGALVTFLVTVAGQPILNIGAPLWALVFGYTASRLMERRDFCPAKNSEQQ